ncbi:MAG TPA: hypothetical protein PKV72_04840, partial [Candidatus Peribacteria bacterium]|nr:hypothetical protein [Candidatus Peribacteria bacterium]
MFSENTFAGGLRRMLVCLGASGILAATGIPAAAAAPSALTYTYDHHLFTVYPNVHPDWKQSHKQWYFQGVPAVPPARLLTCGSEPVSAPGWTYNEVTDWDLSAI